MLVGGCVGVVVSTGDVVTIGDVVGGAVVVSSVMCYEDNTMVWDISFINNQNELGECTKLISLKMQTYPPHGKSLMLH